MAITDSCGNVWDFSESFFVSKNNFTFGPAIKFLRMNSDKQNYYHQWDDGIKRAAVIYDHKVVSVLNKFCSSIITFIKSYDIH